jgi:hypothetical protein
MNWTNQLKRAWGIRKAGKDGRTVILRRKGGFKNAQRRSETKASAEDLAPLARHFSSHRLSPATDEAQKDMVKGGRS